MSIHKSLFPSHLLCLRIRRIFPVGFSILNRRSRNKNSLSLPRLRGDKLGEGQGEGTLPGIHLLRPPIFDNDDEHDADSQRTKLKELTLAHGKRYNIEKLVDTKGKTAP